MTKHSAGVPSISQIALHLTTFDPDLRRCDQAIASDAYVQGKAVPVQGRHYFHQDYRMLVIGAVCSLPSQ
ncbi:hypothetical protein AC579_879 [Pseudocercospora musae]|uniref:Uncharacterized protein n=1 Tax=Pseudocercospora musae TaxID=113226 RepID=A0A139GYE7_9PEZI|nr:hypothetical protein AC579_879 [Pseudocercospora musae]KXS95245.1 hypothetical protein AC579_879 [Pseudocercospora musae]